MLKFRIVTTPGREEKIKNVLIFYVLTLENPAVWVGVPPEVPSAIPSVFYTMQK
jgi:hypothetical protein